MSEETEGSGRINRRQYLNAIGTTGTLVGSSSIVSSSSVERTGFETASGKETARVHRSFRVKSLKKELNGLRIRPKDTRYAEFDEGNHTLEVINASTPSGTLLFGQIGNYTNAALKLDTDTATQSGLPEQYQEIPENTHPFLVGKKDGVVFRRLATDREHQLVADVAGLSADDSRTVAGSDLDGFNITPTPTKTASREKNSTTPIEKFGYDVAVDGTDAFDPTSELELAKTQSTIRVSDVAASFDVEPAGQTDVSTQVNTASNDSWVNCLGACGTCITGVGGGCITCYGVCAGSPTGWGLILCALCIKGSCEVGGTLVCIPCFDCLGDKVE